MAHLFLECTGCESVSLITKVGDMSAVRSEDTYCHGCRSKLRILNSPPPNLPYKDENTEQIDAFSGLDAGQRIIAKLGYKVGVAEKALCKGAALLSGKNTRQNALAKAQLLLSREPDFSKSAFNKFSGREWIANTHLTRSIQNVRQCRSDLIDKATCKTLSNALMKSCWYLLCQPGRNPQALALIMQFGVVLRKYE